MCKSWMFRVAGVALAALSVSTVTRSAAPIGPSASVGAAGQVISEARLTIGRHRVID